jgi:DNA-binding XRE family transcriptional regulator
MKIYTYYVYLIPGVKIGCTTDLEKRMNDQGFTEWEILWYADGNYEFGWIAGDKEKELQELYGYRIDATHYQISRMNRFKLDGSQRTYVLTREDKAKGWKKIGKSTRKLTFKDAEEIRRLYETGTILQKELAERYGISKPAISLIIKRERYNEA